MRFPKWSLKRTASIAHHSMYTNYVNTIILKWNDENLFSVFYGCNATAFQTLLTAQAEIHNSLSSLIPLCVSLSRVRIERVFFFELCAEETQAIPQYMSICVYARALLDLLFRWFQSHWLRTWNTKEIRRKHTLHENENERHAVCLCLYVYEKSIHLNK